VVPGIHEVSTILDATLSALEHADSTILCPILAQHFMTTVESRNNESQLYVILDSVGKAKLDEVRLGEVRLDEVRLG